MALWALTLAATMLIINAAYSAITWPRFLRRVAADPRARDANGNWTQFYLVHRALVVAALTFAAFSIIAVVGVFVFVLPVVLAE